MKPINSDPDALNADDLADMIDRLMRGGTQHINVEIGEEARIQTVNTTDCSKPGACAVPNAAFPDEPDEDENGGMFYGK